MPKIRRRNVPQNLIEHLADRVRLREVSVSDLIVLRDWLDTNPKVPENDWFKAFKNFYLCGKGELVKTVLTKKQSVVGEEVF